MHLAAAEGLHWRRQHSAGNVQVGHGGELRQVTAVAAKVRVRQVAMAARQDDVPAVCAWHEAAGAVMDAVQVVRGQRIA